MAGANIAGMGLIINNYHRMWYYDSAHPGEPGREEQEEIRGTLRERDETMLQKLQEKLKHVESESPRGLVRTEHHLDREKAKLAEHIRRLEHEISILATA
jgi:predicted nuclease with TOPRIM domain